MEREFGLADAVTLFAQQSSNIISLWTIYAVATFTAAGFGMTIRSTGRRSGPLIVCITIGFWFFALGHLALVREALAINWQLGSDLNMQLSCPKPGQVHFASSICVLASTANPLWITSAIHIVIDLCATAALILPVASRRQKLGRGSVPSA